jgi:hypothetical protein
MAENIGGFTVLPRALDEDDLDQLRAHCRAHLARDDAIPCYVMLDALDVPVVAKLRDLVEGAVHARPHYLNDFYFYSDEAFGAGWHMDTELFTFDRCVNAWILLGPDEVASPLTLIPDLNTAADAYYHSVKREDDDLVFANYRTGEKRRRSSAAVEELRVNAPIVRLGDVLLFDPKHFHRTNTTAPKHAIVFKFVFENENGFRSASQVPSLFWSEVKRFNTMLDGAADWDQFLAALRRELATDDGRAALSAGFFPEKIELYQEMAATL